MKYNKDNIIYIDFTFKRKKINSKPHLFLYKLYSRLIKIFPFRFTSNKNKNQSIYNNIIKIKLYTVVQSLKSYKSIIISI